MISKHSEHLSLLFKISWLFAINAIILIRQFKILLNDLKINEIVKEIIKSKLMFYKNYKLLMYFKKTFLIQSISFNKDFVVKMKNVNFFNFKFSNSEDDLLNVKDSINQVF